MSSFSYIFEPWSLSGKEKYHESSTRKGGPVGLYRDSGKENGNNYMVIHKYIYIWALEG